MSALHSEVVRHDGLGEIRVVTGKDENLVRAKAAALKEQWRRRYKAKSSKEKKKRDLKRNLESKLATAVKRTKAAREAVLAVEGMLRASLGKRHDVQWKDLIDNRAFIGNDFSKPPPELPNLQPVPSVPDYAKLKLQDIPVAPDRQDPIYSPNYTLLQRMVPSLRAARDQELNRRYAADVKAWEEQKALIEANNRGTKEAFDAAFRAAKEKAERVNLARQARYDRALQMWNAERTTFVEEQERAERAFIESQTVRNEKLERLRQAYTKGDPEGVTGYCEMILSASKYPSVFPKKFELEYSKATKTLLVEYTLPTIDKLPHVLKVEYLPSKECFREVPLGSEKLNSLYDEALHQICLRTLYELFDGVRPGFLVAINFNGWLHAVNPSTGKRTPRCILSLFAKREQLASIDLSQVDPRSCFRALKGIGSSKLHAMIPVAPLMQIDRHDKRFVEAYEVAASVNKEANLAAMDWEDFEHLVRELFEKEFGQYGGEVKITQASRDGGVDAVAFDPDPIRGGKIVIQAKRYTNVVGLSAVRDLYGTVVNEGATKGILVTTAYYGPDAYDFAKDKPLTLLNGSNLLHLLEKHGHKARIDLHEAKRLLAFAERTRQQEQRSAP